MDKADHSNVAELAGAAGANAGAIERRAWQLCELFRAIDEAAPDTAGAGESVKVLATLGRGLCKELEQFVVGERDQMIGTGPYMGFF